ncbi:hypothetical protein Holit_02275 [Hollandina sp. SP2]
MFIRMSGLNHCYGVGVKRLHGLTPEFRSPKLYGPYSMPRDKGRYQQSLGPFSLVLYLHGKIRGFPAFPKLELDHLFFPFGKERPAEFIGVGGRRFVWSNDGIPYPAAFIGGIAWPAR